jgi:methionyl aminopeptidase
MIILKSRDEIAKMRRAGRIVAKVLDAVVEAADVGVTTYDLDVIAERIVTEAGGKPAFKGYQPEFISCGPFPATLCTSVNDEVVHGIPTDRALMDGDLLSIDTGVEIDGYFGDAAVSLVVGRNAPEARKLASNARLALVNAIGACVAGNHLSDVSFAVQTTAEAEGYSVVRRFVGHGIGTKMHEDPPVPNYGRPGSGPVLKPGMVLAIEPMVNMGSFEVEASPDCWEVRTKDGSLSAHFEHTVAVTESGPEVLTAGKGLTSGVEK